MPRGRVVPTRKTVEERKAERARLGSLKELRVGAHAEERYLRAVRGFCATLQAWQGPLASDYEALDRQLAAYVDLLWCEGMSKNLAADTLSGAQHYLQVKRRFPASWKLITVWSQRELPTRAPPMLPEVAVALCGVALRRQLPGVGLCCLLGFHCMLRTVECFTATVGQLSINEQHQGVLALPLTKSGLRKGAAEMVTVDDPWICLLARRLLHNRAPGECICELSLPRFRKCFKEALAELGLQNLELKPYSLRRGGASWDFRQGGDIQRTIFRGRWDSVRTAKIYIVDGTAALAEHRLSDSQRAQIQAAASSVKAASLGCVDAQVAAAC